MRYASNLEPQSSFEAVQELIGLAAITGTHMHLCHINSTSLKDIAAIRALFEEARAKGINITTEAYPYGAANTVVGAAMFSGDDWRRRTAVIKPFWPAVATSVFPLVMNASRVTSRDRPSA